MRSNRRGVLFAAAGGCLALFCGLATTVSCGGSRCGDGKLEPGELCPQLTVKWEFNSEAHDGFSGDACHDLGVERVVVEAESDRAVFEGEESCSYRQVVFQDLPPDDYRVRVLPLSEEGDPLTADAVQKDYSFQGGEQRDEVVVNVPAEAWAHDYTGTFFFRVSWGGADCAEATPPVTEQILTLYRGQSPLPITTTDGDPMDGSAPAPCRSIDSEIEPYPQSALDVPFGRARLEVTGLDESGEPVFEGSFETFVGAGASNPELMFDAEPLSPASPDDGPPEGG